METQRRPRGRPPKYPPEEVRNRLIQSAIERLRISGVESGLDAITLDGAIVDADVPRGMSYKIWQDDTLTPQEAFRRATVLELLSMPATAGLPATRELTEKLFAEYRDTIEHGDLAQRKATFREMVRVVGGFNYLAMEESSNWQLYAALRTAAISRPDADPALIDVLRASEQYLIDEYSLLYADVCEVFGLELRDGLTIEQFAAASYAANEGLAQRITNEPARRNIQLPSGPDGEMQDWSLFAVAFEALIERFFVWSDAD